MYDAVFYRCFVLCASVGFFFSFFFFFFNDTATTEIYTILFVGSVSVYKRQGNKLVLINKGATSRDSQADLVISDPIGEVLGTVVD